MGYVLITGSSKGIGLEIAKELSIKGHKIIITGKSENSLQSSKKNFNNTSNHKFIQIDFENDEELEKFFQEVETYEIDSIIHNLGGKIKNDTHPIDLEVLNKSINLNFLVSLKINNRLVDKLKENPSKIIYIGSTASLHAKASPCYVLAKSLISSYIKNISSVYLEKNILICGIMPGIVAHKGSEWDNKRTEDKNRYVQMKNSQPLKRFLMPNDITEHVVSLVNMQSLAFTGSMIKLDANDY